MNPSLLDAMQKVADSKIKSAIEEGKFSRLAYFGKPIDLEIDQPDPHWWIRQKCEQEKLSILPPALDLKKNVEQKLSELDQMETEKEVVESLARLNQQIDIANKQILWGPPSRTMPIDIASRLASWREKRKS